ncbi:Energy-coupling factor transporter transmembrane protein EcfT [Corynebacterium aquatimens]|nr:Energy-coupling factor transporter transmembrane protein EcfT [Corynebacterium aquatimens]
MMREIPLGVYVPGHSVIHRAAPGWKFIGLVVFIAVVSFASSAPLHGLSAIGVLFLAYAVAGIPIATAAKQVGPLLPFLAFLGLFLWWQSGWIVALTMFFKLLACVMAATLLTLTTTVEALLQSIEHGLQPLNRIGVPVDLISLAIALTIRLIPLMIATVEESLHARTARGAGFSLAAFGVPVVIRSLRRAEMTGEALLARGAVD